MVQMAEAECPECAGKIALMEGTEVGEIITCADCGCKLEVTAVNPPAVQKAPEVQEDWGE
jgi:alpha-aminoadipate carrier protein LysW